MNLNGYTLMGELQNANSGFSKWGFATKNGREYFVKELISPVYPMDKSIMSDKMFEERRETCHQFERKFTDLFNRINSVSHGNLIRAVEFFRLDSRYYIITDRVYSTEIPMSKIASCNLSKKLLLLKSAANCFYDLHSAGIVHFDVKPTNLLLKVTRSGSFVARLIDFDSGFVKGEAVKNDELGGDLLYLAPETFLAMLGEDVVPDEKSDIFALGLIFHQYMCGNLPYYDEKEYEYPYEAVLNEGSLVISKDRMPGTIGDLISSMLDVDPKNRPSAALIIRTINELLMAGNKDAVPSKIELSYSCYVSGSLRKRKIVLDKGALVYNNVPTTTTRGFPDTFFAIQELKFDSAGAGAKISFNDVIANLNGAGLSSLVSFETAYNVGFGEKDGIKCYYDNGLIQSFAVNGGYTNEFIKIIETLASYCNFPQYDGPVETRTMTSSGTSGGFTGGSSSSGSSAGSGSSRSDWFSAAGDL